MTLFKQLSKEVLKTNIYNDNIETRQTNKTYTKCFSIAKKHTTNELLEVWSYIHKTFFTCFYCWNMSTILLDTLHARNLDIA